MAAEPPLPTPHHHRPVTLTESGPESALLQFYPLQNGEAEGRWALRVLAQLYAPRYFQRLRVDRNVGYVVQCAFHRCADTEGMLFALQSPTFNVEPLRQLTDEFYCRCAMSWRTLALASWRKYNRRCGKACSASAPNRCSAPRNCLGRSRGHC